MQRSRNLKLSTGGWLVPGTGFCFRWKSAEYWPTRIPLTICSLPTETCWSWGVSCDCVLMKPLLATLPGTPVRGCILSQVWCMGQALVWGHHGQWGRLVVLCVVLSWSFSHLPLMNVDPHVQPLAPNMRPAVLFPTPFLPSTLSGWLEVTVKSRLTCGLLWLVS